MSAPTSPDMGKIKQEAIVRAITGKIELTDAEKGEKQHEMAAKIAEKSLRKKRGDEGNDHAFMEGLRNQKKGVQEIPTGDEVKKVIEGAHISAEDKNIADQTEEVLRAVFSGDKAYLETQAARTSDFLIAPIREMMGRDPVFKEIADGIDKSPASLNQWVDFVTEQLDSGRRPGDNLFMDDLQAKYKTFMEKDREDSVSTTVIQRKLERQSAKEKALNDQFESKLKEAGANRDRKNEFASTEKGAGKDLIDLTQKADDEKNDRERIERELGALNSDRARAQEDALSQNNLIRKDAEVKLRELRDSISKKEIELTPFKQTIDKKNALISERDGLDSAYTKILDDQDSLETQIEVAGKEKTKIEAQLANAGGAKDKENFIKEFKAIMGDAFRDTMLARFDAEQAGVSESLKEFIEAARDPHVKAALEQLWDSHNRWKDWDSAWKTRLKIPYGRKEEPKMQKDLMREDVDILLKEGPEGFMRRFLHQKMDPDTKNASHPYGMVYSKEKIDELISDKDFMDAVQPKAAGLLVRQAVKAGVLSERQMAELRDTEWGMSAIESALMMDKTAVESGRAHQAIDYIKKHPKFAWWMLFTILWPPAGLFVAGAYAGKEVVSGMFSGKNKDHGGHDKAPVNVEPPSSPQAVQLHPAPAH
ncbi:MAG: hypothetical protein KBC00_00715 [Candidatus Levybacteria bacterium]|nr:hypothetical protein [Candidatus Levybacteria bacterium]MBP9814716.1 hypothetical protein [Candidatus Levybacteria bacterium]